MTRSALRGVRVYRDRVFGEPEDVVIDGGVIGSGPAEGPEAASLGYLVPGLIDCHHLYGPETLSALAAHGVTTGLDMSSPASLVAALRGTSGVTDIRSPLMAATSPASAHAAWMKDLPLAGWSRRHCNGYPISRRRCRPSRSSRMISFRWSRLRRACGTLVSQSGIESASRPRL